MQEKRYDQIDILRGMFFFPMFIFHIFSAYDLIKGFKTNYSDIPAIKILGLVRNLYIILAGYSIHLAWINYKEKTPKATIWGFIKYKLNRSWSLAKAALLITVISHLLIPEYGIKFGILHFIALGTLLVAPIAAFGSLPITIMFGAIWLYITSNNLIPFSNPIINTITGKFVHWSAADYFPLNRNLILIIGGLGLGQLFTPYLKPSDVDTNETFFKTMGKNSLELYTSHMLIILIVYWTLSNRTR
jgi:uncharacterized membrane protein